MLSVTLRSVALLQLPPLLDPEGLTPSLSQAASFGRAALFVSDAIHCSAYIEQPLAA